ncbi:hypothetical protein [Gandjariella thermophila]|uniref:Uncharacterized protein n=1 Tax=Gandjariella thermophila TaxID=1931992 RepID=A0A4D4JCD2_9PSEU|nr:hypothetical protein [Gandjariella thermophila]GDY31567.1 hypothetical protein GTS_32000 [Gandjariella thermophila]
MAGAADAAGSTAPVDSSDSVEGALRELVARGFHFVHPRDGSGELVAVIGVRPHHGVVDVLRLHAEDDATACRMPGGEPDVLAPRSTLWQVSGAAREVLRQLLALPERLPAAAPDDRGERVARGCWVPVSAGRFRWLASVPVR